MHSSLRLLRRGLGGCAFFVVFACGICPAHAQRFVMRARVPVSQPTRIDWLYPVLGHSPADAPEGLLGGGYDSTTQRYDLYAPGENALAERFPLVLFIPFQDQPMGWDYLGPICARERVIYVEPYRAGNRTPIARRIRIALDCLDDVRRRYPVDPDRTYVAGYSGGAATAVMIGFALPEYFGGVIAASTHFPPPHSAWRIDRLRSGLSIASIVGEKEVPGFEMPRVQTPIFEALGIRMRTHVIPRLGHAAPPPASFSAAFRWLDAAAAARREMAGQREALRINDNPTRQQWAQRALRETNQLLEDDSQKHIGLGLASEIARRWSDLPAAEVARQILASHQAEPERPWEEVARRERIEVTRLTAQVYDRAATDQSAVTKIRRAYYARGAIDNYETILQEDSDAKDLEQIRERLPWLKRLVENVPVTVPSTRRTGNVRNAAAGRAAGQAMQTFSLSGTASVRQVIQHIRESFGDDISPLIVREDLIKEAGLSLEREVSVKASQVTLEELLVRVLRPMGLSFRRVDGEIEIIPAP